MSEKLILESQVEKLVEQTYHADDEFCIDLDVLFPDETGEMIPIWKWSGYSTKQKAINKIYKLKEGIDFLLNQNVKQTDGRGGHNNHQYLFTKDGFKQFLMLSNTQRGEQIRLYFIDVEKRYGSMMNQPTVLTQQLKQIAGELIGSLRQITNETKENSFAHKVNTQAIIENTEEIQIVKKDVEDVKKELTKLKSRKDPKKADKDSCMKLIQSSYYNNSCPCCGEETEVWEIDHFYDSSKNRLSEIWPVCKPCNQKLGTGGDLKKGSFRKDHEIKFELFQQLLMNQNKPNVIQTKLF
jgi:phage anti-repressor protein|tara:strand:+ start:1200 stop:2087 length:888 start_codon:yes stop_codon:yes gene_type:complete